MKNVLMPNVGSGATLEVLITTGRNAAIAAELKAATNADLVKLFKEQTEILSKYLTEARKKMLDTGRAALRQEVRKIEAILSAKDFTILVSDMPEIRFLGNKKNNDLAREAKVLIQYYNTVSEFFHKPTKAEIIARQIDINNIEVQYPNATLPNQEMEEWVRVLLERAGTENPQLSINKIELDENTSISKYWLYAGVGLLIFIILKRRRK